VQIKDKYVCYPVSYGIESLQGCNNRRDYVNRIESKLQIIGRSRNISNDSREIFDARDSFVGIFDFLLRVRQFSLRAELNV